MNNPEDLPVEQWAYGVFQHTVAGGGTPIIQPKPGSQGWRITRIQFANAANPATISVGTSSSFVLPANGCLTLEPSAYLPPFSTVAVFGDDCYIVIEYLYKVRFDGVPPIILVV